MVQEVEAGVDLIFSIAPHSSYPVRDEAISFILNGEPTAVREIIDDNGNRLHRLTSGAGTLVIEYQAEVPEPADGPVTTATELELIEYLRPSRYAQSDELFAAARNLFRGLGGHELITAVRDYVHSALTYAPDATLPTDSAATTLRTGRGVCRDFTHVTVALLRAMDMPARYVSCYAPGLVPMDFHAVAEAWLDGAWHVIDATGLADRNHLVRISVGRDAADCAFLTFYQANATLVRLRPDAWLQEGEVRVEPSPAGDDVTRLVQIR